jgi:hypothetical protein
MSPQLHFRDFTFGEIHQRFRCLKIHRERLQFYFICLNDSRTHSSNFALKYARLLRLKYGRQTYDV